MIAGFSTASTSSSVGGSTPWSWSSSSTPGSKIVDLGASPFIVSCAPARMGYDVVAVDYDPAEYSTVASACGVRVIKAVLERDDLDLADDSMDCALFAEVLSSLNREMGLES
ncbi:MAG: hypothetical protein QXM43_08345 [Desulfurococcaceae archaeon]